MATFTTLVDWVRSTQLTAALMNSKINAPIVELQNALASGDWMPVTLTGAAAEVNYPVVIRKELGSEFVRVRGRVKKSSGTWTGAGNNIGTMPSGFAPQFDRMYLVACDGTAQAKVSFQASGNIRVDVISGAPSTLVLDGITWEAAT